MTRADLHVEVDQGTELVGTLYPATTGPVPVVVAAHGASGGTRDFHLFGHLQDTLPSVGIATLIYDRRGEGASGGSPAGTYRVLAADLRAWIRKLQADPRIDPGRIGLWGISQGGWVAPLAAADEPGTALLVVVSSAGVTPGAQMIFATSALLREAGYGNEEVERVRELRRAMDELAHGRMSCADAQVLLDSASGQPWFRLAFVPPNADAIDASWYEEMEFDIRPALRRLRLPVLLFFGEHDRWIPVAESADVWRSALGADADLTVVSLPGTGHAATFSADPADWHERGAVSPDYERTLVSWLKSRFGSGDSENPEPGSRRA
jgi:pimeloyl-ACP methyl ester carboxylesterase